MTWPGQTIRDLKERLAASRMGIPRFRQRLLSQNVELDDQMPLNPDVPLLLVLLDFCPSDRRMDSLFIAATAELRVREVETMLGRPQDPNTKDPETKHPAFSVAASRGNLQLVQLLLEAGADKNIKSADGLTPLHLAVRYGHLEVARFLVEIGVEKDAETSAGCTALQLAAGSGQRELVEILMAAGANKDAAEEHGWTALHFAAGSGDLEVARLLVHAGASKDAAGEAGSTALHLAASNGHVKVVEFLLEAGASDAATTSGFTALSLAASHGEVEVVRFLIESGVNRDAETTRGSTALHLAAINGHIEVVRLLVKGAKIPAASGTLQALLNALLEGHYDVARFLGRSFFHGMFGMCHVCARRDKENGELLLESVM